MTERRTVRRFELSFPINVFAPASGSASRCIGRTVDISAKGVRFDLKRAVDPGAAINFTITPPEHMRAASIRGRGRVLRIDHCRDDSFGIAASIEGYEIFREYAVDDTKRKVLRSAKTSHLL